MGFSHFFKLKVRSVVLGLKNFAKRFTTHYQTHTLFDRQVHLLILRFRSLGKVLLPHLLFHPFINPSSIYKRRQNLFHPSITCSITPAYFPLLAPFHPLLYLPHPTTQLNLSSWRHGINCLFLPSGFCNRCKVS